VTAPGIPNDYSLSTTCFGARLGKLEDQAFHAVAMGFRKMELGLVDAPPVLNGFEDARRETGMEVTSLVSGCLTPKGEKTAGFQLSSCKDDVREQALNSVRRHIVLAQRLGAKCVTIRGSSINDSKSQQEAEQITSRVAREGPSDATREAVRGFVQRMQKRAAKPAEYFCRSLHKLLSEYPQMKLAVEPGFAIDDLLSLPVMGWIMDDLAPKGLGYWHDMGRVQWRSRCGLPGQGEWLDRFARHMVGIHLQDAGEDEIEMPPGRGEIDFKLIADFLPKSAVRVLEIDPRHGRAEILNSVQFLHSLGI
jgi:sugar phosphate isomerase/epimerase